MPFFHYRQNNSGGSFVHDEEAGITTSVIVEADDAEHANYRAERIGLYFDGVNDCPCCGNRWSSAWSDDEGTPVPTIYDTPLADLQKINLTTWARDKKEIVVHYLDKRVEWFTNLGAKAEN